MKRCGFSGLILACYILQGSPVSAQSSLDVLEQDLKQIKQQHEVDASQAATQLLSALQTASTSSDAALTLYQSAGGKLPDLTPVETEHEHETPGEKSAREAKDAGNLAALAKAAQLHCGLLRFAVLFVVKPDAPGLHDDWAAWLKTAVQIYPQIKDAITSAETETGQDANSNNPNPADNPTGHHHNGGNGGNGQNGGGGRHRRGDMGLLETLLQMTMKDSIIGKYLNFRGWEEKEQGGWKVADMAAIYRKEILDPLRTAKSPDIFAAWDVYINLRQSDASDSDKWTSEDYPELIFEKDSDDFALTPGIDKLAVLVGLLKANPNHPKIEAMTAQVHQMMEDLRAKKAGSSQTGTTTTATTAGPNVTVTTATDGDATIITTKTNAAPVAPKPQ